MRRTAASSRSFQCSPTGTARRRQRFVHEDRAAADDRRGDAAFELPSAKRCVARFRPERRRVDRDREVRGEHGDVGKRAFGERSCRTLRRRAGFVDSSSTSRTSESARDARADRSRSTRTSRARRCRRARGRTPSFFRRNGAARDRWQSRRRCRRRFPPASRRDRPRRAKADSSSCSCRSSRASPATRRSA